MAETYDLELVQGERFRRGFRYLPDGETAEDLSDWSFKAQARQRETTDADLILDLTPHIELDVDNETLWLDLAAATTFGIEAVGKKAAWDCFIWPTADPTAKVMLVQGAVSLDLATTDLA